MKSISTKLKLVAALLAIFAVFIGAFVLIIGFAEGSVEYIFISLVGILLALLIYYLAAAVGEILENSHKTRICMEKLTERFCGELPDYGEEEKPKKPAVDLEELIYGELPGYEKGKKEDE